MNIILDSEGRLALPAIFLSALGIGCGDTMSCSFRQGEIRLRPAPKTCGPPEAAGDAMQREETPALMPIFF